MTAIVVLGSTTLTYRRRRGLRYLTFTKGPAARLPKARLLLIRILTYMIS